MTGVSRRQEPIAGRYIESTGHGAEEVARVSRAFWAWYRLYMSRFRQVFVLEDERKTKRKEMKRY
jgi:hypothetical protein